MVAIAQRSFAGGELAPALYARTDQAKYATGLRTCRNFIVQRHGGVTNRPGLVFVAEAKDSAVACRLIPFVLDATDVADTYILEFGNGYVRFIQDGGRVVVSGVSAWNNTTAYVVGDIRSVAGVNYYCIAAHTSAGGTDQPGVDPAWPTVWYALTGAVYEIPTPYQTADLPDLQFVQSGDVITIVHPSYAPRELARRAHTNWSLSVIAFGPSIAAPGSVSATGGSAGTRRYWAVTAIKENTFEESLAGLFDDTDTVPSSGSPVSVSWSQVPGAISYNVYRSEDGQTYGLINSAGGTPVAVEDTSWTDDAEVATSDVAGAWASAAGQCSNVLGAISSTARAYNGKYTIRGRVTLSAGPGLAADDLTYGRVKVYYSRDGEPRVLAATLGDYVIAGDATFGPSAIVVTIDVPDNGYSTLAFDLVPEVLPAVNGISASMALSTALTPNDSVAWQSNASGFSDVGDAPDYSIGPPTHPTLFDAVGQYPSSVTYFQQRMLLGNNATDPEKVWASRTGSFKSFAISTPLQDDDAVSFSLAGRRVNAVKHLLDLGKLVIFGSGSEQLVDGDEAGILRPDAINVNKISANGSGRLAPIEIDDSAVYVQGRGSRIRDLKPVGMDGYQGTDLTIFATHLFDGYTIVDWAYQQTPNSVIWAVRSDGLLLGLTYLRDQAVWGWHRHDTAGVVENVCVIPEGEEDALYLVVRRRIDGEMVRYIERLAPRYFTDIVDGIFMDSALTYEGWHTGAVTMDLSGGTAWLSTEQLTLTASGATFVAGDVGNAVFLEDADGNLVRLTIEQYNSATVVLVRSDRTVPASLRTAIGNGTGRWALAVDSVSGLDHLEGEAVSIVGDGHVVASPNNPAFTTRTVTGGAVALDRPYAVVHVGLPYVSDIETLDLDTAGQRTNKDRQQLINRVGLYVERSRGIWAGRPDKVTEDDLLAGLQELRSRETEDYDDPTDLLTEPVEINVDASWSKTGRILIRQVDPNPLTVLSATPIGYLAQ